MSLVIMGNRVSGAALAGIFGVTRTIVSRLLEDGVIKRGKDNRFDQDEGTLAYCAHLRRSAAGRAEASATAAARTKSLEASTRLKAAQAKASEAKLRKDSGEVLPFEKHAEVIKAVCHKFRAVMLGLHPQVTRALHLPPAQDDVVRDVIYSALNDLAKGDVLEMLDMKLETK